MRRHLLLQKINKKKKHKRGEYQFSLSSHISNTRVIRVNKYRKTIISNVFFTRVNPSISQKQAPNKDMLFPFHDFS